MKDTKIFLIEDNVVTINALEMRITEMGYENIETAVTGEEAVELAREFQPDIIVSDINLGEGITGIEAVRQIKQEQDIPVVYLTAYDDDKTMKEAGITEPYAYLVKPLQERELKVALSIALYKHKAEKKIKAQAAELKNLNSDKDKFISILAHDLKNPFNSLLGYSELLSKNVRKYDIDKIEKMGNVIHETAERTFDLLNEILLWSRAQAGKIPFEPFGFYFKDSCDSVISVLSKQALLKQIALKCNVPETLEVFTDNNIVKTVLRNLVSNAIKFTNHGGEITINAEKTDTESIVSVRDTGVGMTEDIVSKLFSISIVSSTGGTDSEKGSGLGLLVCKEFIGKIGGRIWAESEIGKGSVFYFTIPVKHKITETI